MNSTSNLTTCPAASSINVTTTSYIVGEGAAVFLNTPSIVRGHNAPRFGHVKNITLAVSGSQADAKSYLVGLLSASLVIFFFFVVFLVVVLIFKCLGYKVVGFLSGSNVRLPTRPVAPAAEPVLHGAETSGHEAIYESGNSGDADDAQKDELNDSSPGDCDDLDKDMVNSDDDEKSATVREQAQGDISQRRSEHELATSQPIDTDLELKEWERKVMVSERFVRRLRIAVILSGLVIVVMAILMVAYGIKGLNSSVLDSKSGLVQGENLAYSGVALINSFMYHQNATLAAAQDVVAGSNETICPQATEVICASSDIDCSVFDGYPSFLTSVEQLYSQLTDTKTDLNEAAALMNDINEYIDKFAWAFWVAAAMVLLNAICTLLILNGVILAWQKKLHGTCWQRTTSRVRGFVIVPVFVVLLILGWIFSMVFVIGSAASGDFCYDSPDANVVVLLNDNRNKFSTSSLVFPALVFYATGCESNSTAVPLPTEMLNVTALLSYLEALNQAIVAVSSNSEEIAADCGTNPEALQNSMEVLASQVCTIATTVTDLVEYFSCPNFNSVYATIAYDALCYNGNAGLSTITITQIIILLCAMVMLTLRAAFYEVVDESELVDPGACRSCCRRRHRTDAEADAALTDLPVTEEVEAPQAQARAG